MTDHPFVIVTARWPADRDALAAVRFYAREGFTAVGDVFEEASIPHVRMELRLG